MSARESRPATAREVFAAHPQMLSAEGAYIPERDDAPEPMTAERLAEIAAELDHARVVAGEAEGWALPEYKAVRGAFDLASLLAAEVERMRAELAARPSRAEVLREAYSVVDAALTVEPDNGRASALYEVLLKLGALQPHTCARSQGLHEKECPSYVPGHELLSRERGLTAHRRERQDTAAAAARLQGLLAPSPMQQLVTRQRAEVAPCGPAPSQCDAEAGEPCGNHERDAAHAEGEHCFCGPECAEGGAS